MLKKVFVIMAAGCTLLGTTGCSSVMTHAGPYQGYYPGAKASLNIIKDEKNGWCLRPLAAIDLPFSAVLDTVLLPYDYFRRDSNQDKVSPRERMLHSSNPEPPSVVK